MKILILTASPFFGGPERQMLELAKTFRVRHPDVECCIGSFPEAGNSRPFLERVAAAGFETLEMVNDFPRLIRAKNELQRVLLDRKIDVLITTGHKARGVGCLLPKSLRIPILTVSRGWTTENFMVRLYNLADCWFHRCADHVIAVSEGQAAKVIRRGTPRERVTVIRNAIRIERFDAPPQPVHREKLLALFPKQKPAFLLCAAGRLSTEKGFDLLVDAVRTVRDRSFPVGLVVFGEGFLRGTLAKQIERLGLQDVVQMPGFIDDLDLFLPHFDLFVQSSHTEGLPNVLLEAMAARTPVVATHVGGTPEVVDDGVTGLLVPPGEADQLADAICRLLAAPERLPAMGIAARERVQTFFTFENQADCYYELLREVMKKV
ncbi:MAG: glycosyltransferase family 4 protein [Planctomycetaceae bacterium]|nr:glycosyltransferase family 4 protein [Planctomycetaceae bacterium]